MWLFQIACGRIDPDHALKTVDQEAHATAVLIRPVLVDDDSIARVAGARSRSS
jgi:hypothetical protein